jgi:hypothetical protein
MAVWSAGSTVETTVAKWAAWLVDLWVGLWDGESAGLLVATWAVLLA